MCILSTFAIIFVVLGHIRFGIVDMTESGTFYGWFPYYSFHLPIFLFISGYFFKDLPSVSRWTGDSKATASGGKIHSDSTSNANGSSMEAPKAGGIWKDIGLFILHKAKNLLLPYYVVTGLFLLFNLLLITWGFTWPQPFTFETWLLAPWTKLYILTFGVPAWYLISLFLAEMYFMFLRLTVRLLLKKLLKKDLIVEIIMLVLLLALGILALIIHDRPGFPETASVYLRSALMLFFMQTGLLYRRHLEKKDTLGSWPYFLIVFIVQFLIILFSGNSKLSPGLYGLLEFGAFGYDYFLAGVTGIALYLRISRILASTTRRSRIILFISSNTKFIMEFHVFGFFLLNVLFSWLSRYDLFSPFLLPFNSARWHSFLYYTVSEDPRMIPLYLFAGIGISLLIAKIAQIIKNAMRRISATG